MKQNEMPPRTPIIAVGTVCWRRDEVALVRRKNPPGQGSWSLPGGRLEWGEKLEQAALRELKEETDLDATLIAQLDAVESRVKDAHGNFTHHHIIVNFIARYQSGKIHAGSDALEAAWFPWRDAQKLVPWRKTAQTIEKSHSRL